MNFPSKISLFILIFCSIFALPALGGPFTKLAKGFSGFSVNLRYGDDSADVQQLQIFLNNDLATEVAMGGPGSPGQETTYFGPATLQAVIKFQNKYASQVLAPVGLIVGTGYVGSSTRAELNQLLLAQNYSAPSVDLVAPNLTPSNSVSSISATQTQPQPQPQSQSQTQNSTGISELSQVSPFEVVPGSTTTLTGTNFLAYNTVFVGGIAVPNVVSEDGTDLLVTIPASTPAGPTKISVDNSNSVYLMVTSSPEPGPIITSVSPNVITSLNQPIIISGSGFTPSSNIIYSPFGTISSVPSAGGTSISFTLSQLPNISELVAVEQEISQQQLQTEGVSVVIGVVNENGPSGGETNIIVTPSI
jgi:hypothetical protein